MHKEQSSETVYQHSIMGIPEGKEEERKGQKEYLKK